MQNYFLAIDVGTTSTKGLAVLPDGALLGQFQQSYPTHYPTPGYAEQDPDEVFQAVLLVIAKTVEQAGAGGLLGVSFSCAMHSLLAVDRESKPLTPLIIWADTRSGPQAEALRSTEQGKRIYNLSGTPIHPMSPLCKLLWIKENKPALFSQAYKFISIKEYVFAKLFGEYVVDYSIASGGGLFDHRQLKWSSEVLETIGMEEKKLSRLVSTFTKFSGLSPDHAMKMNVARETAFIIGGSDGCLAQLGCGAMHPGHLSVTIGTSGAVRMATASYQQDDLARIFNYRLDEKTYIVGGATNNGAVLLSWFAENIEHATPDSLAFIEEAFSVRSSEGLIFLPYLLGERAPIYDSNARGVFFGISIQHSRAHFKRAVLEGICWGLKSIMIALEEVVQPVERIVASGGFVHSDPWVQLLSDILGKPITVDSQNDASALGAALVGFQALGVEADFQRTSGKQFNPDEKAAQHYQLVFEMVESLYDKLKDDFAKLSNLNTYFTAEMQGR